MKAKSKKCKEEEKKKNGGKSQCFQSGNGNAIKS